jgi:hypothetical protein
LYHARIGEVLWQNGSDLADFGEKFAGLGGGFSSGEEGRLERGVVEIGEGATAGLGTYGGKWGEGAGAVLFFSRERERGRRF